MAEAMDIVSASHSNSQPTSNQNEDFTDVSTADISNTLDSEYAMSPSQTEEENSESSTSRFVPINNNKKGNCMSSQ